MSLAPRCLTVPAGDGHPIAVYEYFPSATDGPTVLLAHANGFHVRAYEPVIAALGDSVRVIGFDLRGQGDTPAPAELAFPWDRFGDDALAVVDHFGLERPFGFGHSCGGAVLCIAEQARPGLFCGLFLYEPILHTAEPAPTDGDVRGDGPRHPGPAMMAAGARRRRERFDNRAAARASYAAKPQFAAFDPEALRLYVQHGFADQPDGSVLLKARGEHEARVYDAENDDPAPIRLDHIRCPTVVAWGATTLLPPPEMFAAAARSFPHCRTLHRRTLHREIK